MIHRLLLVGVLLGSLNTQVCSQDYFSKIYPFEQGTHRYISVESVDTNLFWLQTLKWLPVGVD